MKNIAKKETETPQHPYVVGKNYFVRTVTHYYTGRVVAIFPQEIVLEEAAWIPDSGRFTQAIKDGSLNEVEPFPADQQVIIGRGSIIDATQIKFALPSLQK